jgi:hypothetical protein
MADSGFPEGLRPFKRFLVQANQLQKVDPLVAYYCRLFAVTRILGLPKAQRDAEVNAFLGGLITALEKDKSAITGQLDNDADYEKVKDFADNVFAKADSEDRDGNANIKTSHAFMTSFVLYEVLAVFSEEKPANDAEVQQKMKYAKWKAADIAKAIKEGRKPNPGGPNEKKTSPAAAPADDPPPEDEPEPEEPAPKVASRRGSTGHNHPPAQYTDEKKKQDGPPKGYVKVKNNLGVKDIARIKALNLAESLTREALQSLRLPDPQTAREKLQEALAQL